MSVDLQGKTILITRPEPQAEHLTGLICQRGGIALPMPLIAIRELKIEGAEKQKVMNLDRFDSVIVTSPNAARILLDWTDRYWPQLPAHIAWYAVGAATARVLEEAEIMVHSPDQGWDSEALLALPGLAQPQGSRILIAKGVGGRTLLRSQLLARGSTVETLELYRRELPDYSNAQILERLNRRLPDFVFVTSMEILERMHQLLSPCYQDLLSVNLVTASQRISNRAVELGYRKVKTAAGASDEAMLTALSG